MKSKYQIFIIKLFALFSLLIVIDFGTGKLLEYFFLKLKAGQNANVTYAINNAEEDLIIFGSSKANHNYDPSVFKDSLQISTFNAGIDGQTILYHFGVLKCVLARKAPKVIILDLHPDEFELDRGYDELSILLPYYYTHKEIQPVINLRGKFEKYKVLSGFYRFNSLPLKIISNSIKIQSEGVQGYIPLNKTWNKSMEEKTKITSQKGPDMVKIDIFKSFLKEAKNAGSTVIVCISPLFEKRKEISKSITIARKICQAQNVQLLDFSQDNYFFSHPENFSDPSHLSAQGAEIYSKFIAHITKEIINK
ncbi:MAG: esterase, hydrolase-type domain [Chitinophagaceae bacterium]|nr:esterase, hydrolase-type domain [Chitinophagaceae bacterium]